MIELSSTYAAAILGKGAPLQTYVGFIDGPGIHIARPRGDLQRSSYRRHKRRHVLKFQSACIPDGLLFHIFGPVEVRRYDMFLYHESGLYERLLATMLNDGVQYCIYGDSAYILHACLQSGHGTGLDRNG